MNSKIISLLGLTIDISSLRSLFASDGVSPRWSGKVVLTLIDGIGKTETVVTANWAGKEESRDGMLCDFEGESEDSTVYEACEAYAPNWSARISERIGRPSYWDAHHNDLADRRTAPKAA
jgi:hypothetical protein